MARGQHPHHRGRHGPRSRNRSYSELGGWQVQARIERFVEPALLLLLSEGATHGYDLADRLASLMETERVDYGNLYRALREAETEGIVSSEWNDDLPGRTKRTYRLTPLGAELLDAWVSSLRAARDSIDSFLERCNERNT